MANLSKASTIAANETNSRNQLPFYKWSHTGWVNVNTSPEYAQYFAVPNKTYTGKFKEYDKKENARDIITQKKLNDILQK